MEGAHRRAPLEEPFEASRGWWCRRGTSRLIAALLLTLFVGSARAQSWCQDSEFDISKHDICLQPSIGPDTGGTPLIIKGFNDIIYPDWPTQCQFPERWACIFGSDAPSVPAVSVDCGSGFVKCVTPPNVSPSDPEARLPFDVLMNVVITGETQSQIFPRLGREPVHFAFFDVTFLSPIGGVWGMRPTMEIALLNAKQEETFWCRFIPFCQSEESCGWDFAAMGHAKTVSIVQNVDGVPTNRTYATPPDVVAGFLRTGRIRCGLQDDLYVLKKDHGYAQLWVEVAIDRPASDGPLTFSQNERIFTLYRPPNVTGVSVASGPYSGKTEVIFQGQGFYSFLGLSCRLLWCLDYSLTVTCQYQEFLAKPMSIDMTSVKCTTAEYFPNDEDCKLCLPGGTLAGFRAVQAETDVQYRDSEIINCCGDSCCSERSRVQLALDGTNYIPTFDGGTAGDYVLLENAPKVFYTMYQPPILQSVKPAAGPLAGGGIVTISGLNMFPASLNVSAGKVFCRFTVYRMSSPTVVREWVPATFVSDEEVTCVAPPSDRNVSNVLGLTINGQNFHEEPHIRFSFFYPLRAEPPFGGWLGATIVRIVGYNMDAMEGGGNVPDYKCKFITENNGTYIVPGAFSPGRGWVGGTHYPDAIACSAPAAEEGPVLLQVSLAGDVYSNDTIPFEYVEEAFVYVADPISGPATGGYTVRLSGGNFKPSEFLRCRFGDIIALAQYVSESEIVCIAPESDQLGMVQVYALNNGQQLSATFTTFTYYASVDVVPDGGPVEGGTHVLVTLSSQTYDGFCKFGRSVVQGRVVQDPSNLTEGGYPRQPPALPKVKCTFNCSEGGSGTTSQCSSNSSNMTLGDYIDMELISQHSSNMSNGTINIAAIRNASYCYENDLNSSWYNGYLRTFMSTYLAGLGDMKYLFSQRDLHAIVVAQLASACSNCQVEEAPPDPPGKYVVCQTLNGMSNFAGEIVPFGVSINNRDFAVANESKNFTFYPRPRAVRLLPESGPIRGGTGVTVIGSNFFSLCKTGTNELTGVCYRCDQESPDTFQWTAQSSCKETIPGLPVQQCGLPCRPGKDDRDAFGSSGRILCGFGDIRMPARLMTQNRIKCFSPRSPDENSAVRLLTGVSGNGQQFTPEPLRFSYYSLLSVSPKSGPTYGDTIVSVSGFNLFTGAREGTEVQCKFWLDIIQLGRYDPDNDVVLCAIPQQPAELKDSRIDTIEFSVTLNYRIAEQYTDNLLTYTYIQDTIATEIYPDKGPMNGGFLLYLKLPFDEEAPPTPDLLHNAFPYNPDQHYFALQFVNDSSFTDRRSACFGGVTSFKHSYLQVPQTCCDNIETETVCDGVESPTTFLNSSFLSVLVPSYPAPDAINIELSANGVTDGTLNPTAQFTRQAFCDQRYYLCGQANEGSSCLAGLDCGGLVLRLWGIFSLFPISFDIAGQVDVSLFGNNFLHPEDQTSSCYWFVDGVTPAVGAEYATTPTYVLFGDCDECPARDENDKCVIERFCRMMRCRVPAAPTPIGQAVTVELSFGPMYPLTQQGTNVYYFSSADIRNSSVSVGPTTGGTVITMSGSGFVNSPDLLCQFGNPAEGYSPDLLHAQAHFIDSKTIACVVPECDTAKIVGPDILNCSSCRFCNVKIRVTMNQRDFVDGELHFWYRPVPTPQRVFPVRAPANAVVTNLVTITGLNFSDPGGGNNVRLSCKFGASVVPASVPPECKGRNTEFVGLNCSALGENVTCPSPEFCSRIFCVPPSNPAADFVDVFVSVDGQQFYKLSTVTGRDRFGYYSVAGLTPEYVLSRGGAVVRLEGANLDKGADYACLFTGNGTRRFASASSISETEMECSVPSLVLGGYSASASLDPRNLSYEERDFTTDYVSFATFAEAYVTALQPTRGQAAGGVQVTVTGTGFWDSPLLQCAFGGVVAPSAVFVDNTTILCTSPKRNGTFAVEVSFNRQEFSNGSVLYNGYLVPRVRSVLPRQLPAETSQRVRLSATDLEDFETLACLFSSVPPASRWKRFSVLATFVDRQTLVCQFPPSPGNSEVAVEVSLDGIQVSGNAVNMRYYDVAGIDPIVAQLEGGTVMDVQGHNLADGDAPPLCLFAAQPGLDLENSTRAVIYAVYVDAGGAGYADGVYEAEVTSCIDGNGTVYDITVDTVAQGYFNGLYDLQVSCEAPCTGSGLKATYTVTGEVVKSVQILDPGSGYSAEHPPSVSVWGCDGIGGSLGICMDVNFTVLVGDNCAPGFEGCCERAPRAKYSVLNGSIANVALLGYDAAGFNHLFPPTFGPANCDGRGGGEALGCRVCKLGEYVPSGTCAGGGSCLCSGFKPYCSDGSVHSCTCTPPNDGSACLIDADCTGSGRCRQSAAFRAIVANVTQSSGSYTADGTAVSCVAPPVTFPDSVLGFTTVQSASKTYSGMALTYLKVKVHSGTEFSPKAGIFRYAEAPTVTGVYPNSASSRGGTIVSVFGSGFRNEDRLTTVKYPSGSEDTLVDMSVVCKLHDSLESQPAEVFNSTLLLCRTNRVCFDGSTQSGCQECIVEGCAQPVLSYSHSLPTDTKFSARISLNDQNFAGNVTFFVYSITSFRPFGGVYNGGTHVTISGIGFDRGGEGPYGSFCRFSRIKVPAVYDSTLQVVKCLSQPLLDVLTVLEVHLGENLEDESLYTDNGHIFHYYTAFPSGLAVYPDSGSFSGNQPVSLSVPKPMQFNHFRFRSFDFNTRYEGVTTTVLVEGMSVFNPFVDFKIEEFREILFQELYALRGTNLLANRDVVIEQRRGLNLTNLEMTFRIEPAEDPQAVVSQVRDLLSGPGDRLNAQLVRFGISTDASPFLVSLRRGPEVFSYYSESAAFARFGPVVTSGQVYNSTMLTALIAKTPVESSSTVQVSFNINGQQFSLIPLNFFYYTVAWVTPFGIPVSFGVTANQEDALKFRVCPEESGFLCDSTAVPTEKQFATIRVYGNNFRKEIVQVDDPTYPTPMCKYGDLGDSGPGLIGSHLKQVVIEPALGVNYDEGWVDCRQPDFGFDLLFPYDEGSSARRIRLEVALNGRDFSYSALPEFGEAGLVLFKEPSVVGYQPNLGPISGGTTITVLGENFRPEASSWRTPTCFCLFSVANSISGNPAWVKVPATVKSPTVITCVTPPFSQNSYGYAAATFRPPPVDIPLFVSLNGHHWHAGDGRFSFFDILRISPKLSQNDFPTGDGDETLRDMTVEVGSFSNPGNYKIFCWWRVPGYGVSGGFVIEGTQRNQGIYACRIPDWKSIPSSLSLLPCHPPGDMGDGAVCAQDGSMTVKFGVAFAPITAAGLTPLDFSFSKTYTFYAKPQFFDFLPKIGDQLGGTEVHVYGENFLDLPTLQCKFGDSAPNIYPATEVIFKSENLVVCVSPRKALLAVLPFSITLNNVHWMKCDISTTCFHNHPYYGGRFMPCCEWEEQVEHVKQRLTVFTWAKRPSISILQPDAAPTQGDTDLKIIGNSLTPGNLGTTFTCRIDGDIIMGVSKNDGGVQLLTCLTLPNMRAGLLPVQVSVNGFEWSNTNVLTTYEPLRAFRVNPSFVVWDDPWPSVTIVGKNFKQQDAGVGQIIVRLAEFDEDGVVRWKKDMSPVDYGNEMADVFAPDLEGTTETDILTIEPPKRSPCTQAGARFCEVGVIKVFVSQNEANDWTWEDVELAYIARPTSNTLCYGGTADGFCAVESQLIPLDLAWDIEFLDVERNKRGTCETGGTDALGQAMTTGNCTCTTGDCAYYDCGNFDGKVVLGCSVKAAITDVRPRSGPQAGGTLVQIRGHKFEAAETFADNYWCKFGTQAIKATFDAENGLIECFTPPLQKNGSVEVEVSISNQREWTVSHGYHTFHYFYPPTVMGLEPSIGPATGYTSVSVTGGFTDKLMALGTMYRQLQTDNFGAATCGGGDLSTGLCNGMYVFGAYSDKGPITPGLEHICVRSDHCRYQLYQQHNLACEFSRNVGTEDEVVMYSVEALYLLPNVIECTTPPYEEMLNRTQGTGPAFEDLFVRLTLNGQLWHDAPVPFRYHAYNNITKLVPEVAPALGGTWITLYGTGFINTHLTICMFGTKRSLAHEYISENLVRCIAPPSDVLQKVPVAISFNGAQFTNAVPRFEYVQDWSMIRVKPQISMELGGSFVSVIGEYFLDASALACKFGDIVVERPDVDFVDEQTVRCRVPRNIITRPRFVGDEMSCDGTYIEGSFRTDAGWTICAECTDCCSCPNCPECYPSCLCPDASVAPDLRCCVSPGGQRLVQDCVPKPQLKRGTARALCLPPEYDCKFVSTDETTKILDCTLLPFKGTVYTPPQDTKLYIGPGDFLHPDLALRLTVPFFLSLDSQSWFTGCATSPRWDDPLNTLIVDRNCPTADTTTIERWFGTFTFIEVYNATRFKPSVAPVAGDTLITIYGEGFVETIDIRCRFGFASDGTFDPDNPRDDEGELAGVVPNEAIGTFRDSFSVVCRSPELDRDVYNFGEPPNENFVFVPLQVSINGLDTEFTSDSKQFVYSTQWVISRIEPKNSPSIGGTVITFFGPYFHDSESLMCKFGELFATTVKRVSPQQVECRAPSVQVHQRVNVSITVDGSTWSIPSNATVMEYFGVRNVMLFGENEYGQLGFSTLGPRVTTQKMCEGGLYKKFDCEEDSDCPAGICLETTLDRNFEPTFMRELFARNVTGIAMGQTHTMLIASETYADEWDSLPRRGLIYIWGDNLVGQLGHGFAGDSEFEYNFSTPMPLVCSPDEIYLLDRRVDGQPVVGLPNTWPEGEWIVPTCNKTQDVFTEPPPPPRTKCTRRVPQPVLIGHAAFLSQVFTEGTWLKQHSAVYNPFYYDDVITIACGSFHSLAITANNHLFAWGWNNDGQLGQGPLEVRPNIPFPVQVDYFTTKIKKKIVKVSAGFAHTAVVTLDGELYTWGNNRYGQLGLGDFEPRKFPALVQGFIDSRGAEFKVNDVKCGLYHCLVQTTTGSIWSFGSNSRGQLGTCASAPTVLDSLDLECVAEPAQDKEVVFKRPFPKKIDFMKVTDFTGSVLGQPFVTKFAAGAFHSTAVASPCITPVGLDGNCPAYDFQAGDLYVWGNNKYGQLGTGSNADTKYEPVPKLITMLNTISARCRFGQVDDCVQSDNYFRIGKIVKDVSAGSWHTLVSLNQREDIGYRRSSYQVNRLFSMGNNEDGQLGQGDTVLRNVPTQVESNFVKFHELGGNFYQSIFTLGCPPEDGNVCSGSGFCREQGVCDCQAGFRGQDCSIECDGGAETPCSQHGSAANAVTLAQYRQRVIAGAAGYNLRRRLDTALAGYYCPGAEDAGAREPSRDKVRCDMLCGRECVMTKMLNLTSGMLVDMLDTLVADHPAMKTAVGYVKDDWPIHMYVHGKTGRHKFPYQARQERLSASTVGPDGDGLWREVSVLPILHMLQNRSTCWRDFSCAYGDCITTPGYTRFNPGASRLDVNPGCIDGWTASKAFKMSIEQVDQAWSNLEIENSNCDPLFVANKLGIQKEQVHFIWSSLELDPGNITRNMNELRFAHITSLAFPIHDPKEVVRAVQQAFSVDCQNFSISQTLFGCMTDGTCVCEYGWTGTKCSIPCRGGPDNPCSGHGTCRHDGACECDRGYTGRDCSIECAGAENSPGHWPCHSRGMCEGWFVDPRTQHYFNPVESTEEKYFSIGRQATYFDIGTELAVNGTCDCHYGYRSSLDREDCDLMCPGVPSKYLDELGECYDNGVCDDVGFCICYDGYRNVSCDVQCSGGHKYDFRTDAMYSNECTAKPVCDVYPDYLIYSLDGPVFCRDMLPDSDDYSRDYSVSPGGEYLRVHNGLCQFYDRTDNPPLAERKLPIPDCPGPEWCSPELTVAGPGGQCYRSQNCLEQVTRTKNYTGQPYNSSAGKRDPLLGPPPDGCPAVECDHLAEYAERQGYAPDYFGWHPRKPDTAPHHSAQLGRCYCLEGFRGEACEKMCPGATYSPDWNIRGVLRKFPLSLDPNLTSDKVYGTDIERGWDFTGDGIPEGIAGRPLINICSGQGFCEEDASCSCFLTDRGPHTNFQDVSGYRGEACDIECQGGAYSICSSHGVCGDLGECTCHKGYRNVNCNISCRGNRDCDPATGCGGVCNYAGECDDYGDCTCDPAYRGDACEKICPPWDGVLAHVCNGVGECDERGICLCDAFHQGEACEQIAAWVIFMSFMLSLTFTIVAVHTFRRWLHNRMRQRRRARRDRRKVRRTQAAVSKLRHYEVQAPDAIALEAKGI